MKKIISRSLSIFTLGTGLFACSQNNIEPERSPNIVLVNLDDAGWSDFQPFAQTRYPTPNVNRMAMEGRVFYNFYVPHALCSASRAALLTGAYPERTGVVGAHGPGAFGLHPRFATLGEIMKENGYATAVFGKWHIGDQPETRPSARGFDESSGIMYSNDMWAAHPERPQNYPLPLRYWKNGEVAIDSVTHEHQPLFTRWATEDAVDFINRNHRRPFFLYVPHIMPHVPLFVSEKFDGISGTGLYGDVIMELDWSVGEIMRALKDNGIDGHTILLFTSDNGPWLSYGNHAGKTPFRGDKATTFDGGIRVPLIIRYPGHIEANTVSHDAFFSIDLLPTFAFLTGASLPENEIDGKNVWDLIAGKEGAVNPHEYYSLTLRNNFHGVMRADGKWKLQLPHACRVPVSGGRDGSAGVYTHTEIDTSLFDLVHDPYEKVNVFHLYPEIARELIQYADEHQRRFFE